MKDFVRKSLVFALVSLAVLEVLSRVFIDPFYFNFLNTYNEKKENTISFFPDSDTPHVDYLFIGSSRIPATINASLLSKLAGGATVVNAGRGLITPGIHYQAVTRKIENHPEYLRNANVFVETFGFGNFLNSFETDRLRVYESFDEGMRDPRPNLLLPHLDFKALVQFFKVSQNSFWVKLDMVFLQSSIYRSSQLINEKFNKTGDMRLLGTFEKSLTDEGGIRSNDLKYLSNRARIIAENEKERLRLEVPLSVDQLNKSTLWHFNKLVKENGGRLYLYEVPLHSIQKEVYSSEKSELNKRIFDSWCKDHNIEIVSAHDFQYSDDDFPDIWHLGLNRRDEFTTKLYSSFQDRLQSTK